MSLKLFYKDKKFYPLLWTQFFGALNDNFYKNALVVLVTFKSVELWGMNSSSLVAFCGGVFILPFVLFSPLAGQISDKMSKDRIIRITKWFELFVMLVGVAGFYFDSTATLVIILFLMGTQSAFFGPTKYSVIPDLAEERMLTTANAYVQMSTFIAILIGTILGGLAAGQKDYVSLVSLGILFFAGIGIIAAYKMPFVSVADPEIKLKYNPFPQIGHFLNLPRFDKTVFNSVLSISWFWFLGAGILSVIPVMTKNLLQSSEEVVTLFLAIFTIGIAIGAIVCERISREKVKLILVPLAALAMTAFLLDLSWLLSSWDPVFFFLPDGQLGVSQFFDRPNSHRLVFDLFLFSVMGGLYTVPLYTFIQKRVSRGIRSRIVAANNIYNAFFMVISSVMLMGLYALSMTFPQVLLVYALLNLVMIAYICFTTPEFIHQEKRVS